MVERRTLEDVLEDLKQAEKEYKEKCLKYGITEKIKRKRKDDSETVEDETISENIEGELSETDNNKLQEVEIAEDTNNEEIEEEISEN